MANLPVTINNFVQKPLRLLEAARLERSLAYTLTVLALNIGRTHSWR